MQIRDARLKRLKKLREDKKYEVDIFKSLLVAQFITQNRILEIYCKVLFFQSTIHNVFARNETSEFSVSHIILLAALDTF